MSLAALKDYRQFILWRLVPDGDKKPRKVPVDYRTGLPSDPLSPANWMDYATAKSMANNGYNLGFTFTKEDPFFFLDIDACIDPSGKLNDIASALCGKFCTAAIETSQSGTGLHIFGTGHCPEHGCKNTHLNLELYTEKRFVALTEDMRNTGSAEVDCSDQLSGLVVSYFPPDAGSSSIDWTSEPVEEWDGYENDKQLIAAAKRSKSAAGMFGDAVTFTDLWERNVDKLAFTYPPQNGSSDFDGSSADASLAQHLSFWTGSNCERIQRIMEMSGLVRDKWNRDDYMRRTILRAAGRQEGCHTKNKPSAVTEAVKAAGPAITEDTAPEVAERYRHGAQIMTQAMQIEYFSNFVYVSSQSKVFDRKTGSFHKPAAFQAMFGGYIFLIDALSDKQVTSAFTAFTESQFYHFDRAQATTFLPLEEPGGITNIEGLPTVNTFVKLPIARQKGDVTLFLNHLKLLLPNGNDAAQLLAYMAAVVQYQGFKFVWCPFIQGVEGNGKSILSEIVSHAVGKRYTHLPKASNMHSNFNSWVEGKIFIGIEEIYVTDARMSIMDSLKVMITGGDQGVEPKGIDQHMATVCCNFILNSNHKDALKLSKNDRRFAMFFTDQQSKADLKRCGMTREYFYALNDWMRLEDGFAMITDYLMDYDIPHAMNPAKGCREAPETTSSIEAMGCSTGAVEQEVEEAIAAGYPGFAGGWISSKWLDVLLDNLRIKMSRANKAKLIGDMGYVQHPNLTGGRPNNPIPLDGGKSKLFIRKNSIHSQLTKTSEIVNAYVDAQSGATQAEVIAKAKETFA